MTFRLILASLPLMLGFWSVRCIFFKKGFYLFIFYFFDLANISSITYKLVVITCCWWSYVARLQLWSLLVRMMTVLRFNHETHGCCACYWFSVRLINPIEALVWLRFPLSVFGHHGLSDNNFDNRGPLKLSVTVLNEGRCLLCHPAAFPVWNVILN